MSISPTPRQTRARPAQKRTLDAALILALIKEKERTQWTKICISLLLGMLLLPVGPLVINVALWVPYQAVNVIFRNRFDRTFLFWPHYWIVAVISLPLLFLLATLVRGSPLDAAAENSGESFKWAFGMVPLALLEAGNIGPRLMVSGIRQWRVRRGLGAIDPNHLVDAILRLSDCMKSVSPLAILQPGQSANHLEQILPILLFYDIADISKTGDRVWLSSSAKRRLGCE
jgi:hypothetical protein